MFSAVKEYNLCGDMDSEADLFLRVFPRLTMSLPSSFAGTASRPLHLI